MSKVKELEVIFGSFACNRNCPFCTAQITRWPLVEDDMDALREKFERLAAEGYEFNFISLGGNGEPSLYSMDKLRTFVELASAYPGDHIKRILTSGDIYFDDQKFALFNDAGFYFETTMVSPNVEEDMAILHYDRNFFDTDNFRSAKVRINLALTNDRSDRIIEDTKLIFEQYPNVEVVGLKLLNINTYEESDISDVRSQWIATNAIPKTRRDMISRTLSQHFKFKSHLYDTMTWTYNDREVYFSSKQAKYGYMDVVFYGNRLVDYQLRTMEYIIEAPKLYFAMKFKKTYKGDVLSLADDLRSRLLGSEHLLLYANDYSFVNQKYKYIGPFYNEKASEGVYTSDDCAAVVSRELGLVASCDVVIAILDNEYSPGSIAELVYAATLGKKIVILCERNDAITYSVKNESWFPITMVSQLTTDVEIKFYDTQNDLEQQLAILLN